MDEPQTLTAAFLHWLNNSLAVLLILALFARIRRPLSRWLLGSAACLLLVRPAVETILVQIWGDMIPIAYLRPAGNFSPGVFTASVIYNYAFALPPLLAMAAVLLGGVTDEEQKALAVGMRPSPIAGKIRPAWKVLLLSVVTLSVYFWIYLYKSIRELGFATDVKVRKELVRNSMAWWLLSVVATALALGGLLTALISGISNHLMRMTSNSALVPALIMVGMFVIFIRLLREARRGLKMTDRSFIRLYALLSAWVACNAASSFGVMRWPAYGALPSLAGGLAGLLLICFTIAEINEIWRRKSGHSVPVGAPLSSEQAAPPAAPPVG